MNVIQTNFSKVTLDRRKGIAIKESMRNLDREIEVLRCLRDLEWVPNLIDVLNSKTIILEYVAGSSTVLGHPELTVYKKLQDKSDGRFSSSALPTFFEVIESEVLELQNLLPVSVKFRPVFCKLFNLMTDLLGVVPKRDLNGGKILCHGDLHEKNVIARSEGLVFLDWEDSFLGSEYLGYSVFFHKVEDFVQFVGKESPGIAVQTIMQPEILVWLLGKSLFLKDYVRFALEHKFSEESLSKVLCEIRAIEEVREWVRNQ